MGKPGMEDKGFRFAESIDHAMQEADEKSCVKAHGAGRVEQENEPQRLDLAAEQGEFHQRAPMRDISMNGPAQIETSSAPADALTPHQTGSHRARKTRCEGMCSRTFGGVHNVTQIGTCEVLEARSALALAAAITSTASI